MTSVVDTCDVVIVGGGPAGSACAWGLRRSGLDVVVADKADFPRDKVCAGWITPQVIDDLGIDIADYREGRTFQPITAFRVGLIGGDRTIDTEYDRPVSFGIRRCEFDDYLLRRAGARRRLGMPIASVRRDGTRWVIDETLSASMLVGAGGHFCPVARLLNGSPDREPLVVAQETEFRIDAHGGAAFRTHPERPELYFCADLTGYGWCFRKGEYLNIGFGRLERGALPKASAEFVRFLKARGTVPSTASWRWHGHAYLLSGSRGRRVVDDAVLLAGDAAGVAYPQSGEGIRPAIESGLMAASSILHVQGCYARDRLEPYEEKLRRRFGVASLAALVGRAVPAAASAALARRLLDHPWFVRSIVLDRWFLRSQDEPLATRDTQVAARHEPVPIAASRYK